MRLQARISYTIYDDTNCAPDDATCEPVEYDDETYLYGHDVGSLSAVEEILMDLQSMLDNNPDINSWFTDIPLSVVCTLLGRRYEPDSAPTVFVDTKDGHTCSVPGTDFLAWHTAADYLDLPDYCSQCGGYLVPGASNHRHIRHVAA